MDSTCFRCVRHDQSTPESLSGSVAASYLCLFCARSVPFLLGCFLSVRLGMQNGTHHRTIDLKSDLSVTCLTLFLCKYPWIHQKAKLLYVYTVPLYILYFTIKSDFLVIYTYITVWILFDNLSLEILIVFIVLMECPLFLSWWLP